MSITLPLDLHMHICDVLAVTHEHDTIKSCALASSLLTPHCQKLLFNKVSLRFRRDNGPSVQRLSDVVENCPALGSYIRRLHITFGDPQYFYHQGIPRILSRCTNIAHFDLRCRESHLDNPDWPSTLPEPTLLALESILYSPSLVCLTVFGFNLPMPTVFNRCRPSLKEIDITGVGVIDESDLPAHRTDGLFIFPHCLHVEPPVIFGILEAKSGENCFLFDLSYLQVLSTYTQYSGDVECINQALLRATNLQSFALTLDGAFQFLLLANLIHWLMKTIGRDSTIFGLFDSRPRCLSTVRHVEAEMSILRKSLQTDGVPFHGLLVELQRFPAQNALETIILRVILHYEWDYVEEDWLSLVTLFSKGSFPCLKSVDIIAVVEDWSDEEGYMERYLSIELGKLSARLPPDLHFHFNATLDVD